MTAGVCDLIILWGFETKRQGVDPADEDIFIDDVFMVPNNTK